MVVYRGSDGRLHEWWMDKTTGQWGTAGPVADNLAADPLITATSGGVLQVIARGTAGELRNISMARVPGSGPTGARSLPVWWGTRR